MTDHWRWATRKWLKINPSVLVQVMCLRAGWYGRREQWCLCLHGHTIGESSWQLLWSSIPDLNLLTWRCGFQNGPWSGSPETQMCIFIWSAMALMTTSEARIATSYSSFSEFLSQQWQNNWSLSQASLANDVWVLILYKYRGLYVVSIVLCLLKESCLSAATSCALTRALSGACMQEQSLRAWLRLWSMCTNKKLIEYIMINRSSLRHYTRVLPSAMFTYCMANTLRSARTRLELLRV